MIKIFDKRYTLEMTPGDNDYYVDFACFKFFSFDGNIPEYRINGFNCNLTKDISKAECLFEGFIKWDGCMEMNFDNPFHVCGPEDILDFSKILIELYKMAKQMIPNAD